MASSILPLFRHVSSKRCPLETLQSLLHISDVHFGPAHQRDRAAGVLDLIAARRPDFVVISGDLTQRAKPSQFQAARRFVERIEVPVLVVPGNHDVPLYRFWERFACPLRPYRKHFCRNLEPSLSGAEVLLVGINTAFNYTFTGGRIRPRQLETAKRAFAQAPLSTFKIVVLHHHLIPPPDRRAPRVAWGAARALHDLSAAGVDLVLAGHLHRSFVARAVSADLPGSAMIILHSGTTTSSRGRAEEEGRNSCHWIEVGAAETNVAVLSWEGAESGFVEQRCHRFARRAAAEG